MKVMENQDVSKYVETQIQRSRQKFSYCKVSFGDVFTFKKVLKSVQTNEGPVLCLGTRNGREIDIFRNVLFNNRFTAWLVKVFEIKRFGKNSILPVIEWLGRSSLTSIHDKSVIGVEVNPDAARKDTWIGSFDEMPQDWTEKFSIVYSNSFDQSQDPFKTAKEWRRVMAKGGILIIGFTDTPPTESDPVGNLKYTDILELFGGELVYFNKYEFNYRYVIIKV